MATTETLNSFYKNAQLLPNLVYGYIAMVKSNTPRQEEVLQGVEALIEELKEQVEEISAN